MFARLLNNSTIEVPFIQDKKKENVEFVRKHCKKKHIHYRSLEYRRPQILNDIEEEGERVYRPTVFIHL